MAIFSITTDKETAKIIERLKKENKRFKDALKLIASSTGLVEGYMKKIAKEALKEQGK